MRRSTRSRRVGQRGRSLVELMVALAIGLVVLGAVLAMYAPLGATGRQAEATARMSEDAAVAMNYLGSYLRMAGYSRPQVNAPRSSVTVGGGTQGLADSHFVGAGLRGCDDGFTDPKAAGFASLTCANGAAGASAVAIRFEADTRNTFPSTDGQPTDCLAQKVGAAAASALDPSVSFTLVESRFFVRQGSSGANELYCNGNGAGSGGGASWAPMPLVPFVEHLQLRYGIAADGGSGRVQDYVSAADIDELGGTLDQNWSRVISVKACIVLRSETANQGPDAAGARYVDCDGQLAASPDRYIRRSFTSVFTLRNRAEVAL